MFAKPDQIPKAKQTWPLNVLAQAPGDTYKYIVFQIDHNKQKTVPARIQYTAEVDLDTKGFVLHLENKALNAQSPVLKFYYTVYYKGKAPSVV